MEDIKKLKKISTIDKYGKEKEINLEGLTFKELMSIKIQAKQPHRFISISVNGTLRMIVDWETQNIELSHPQLNESGKYDGRYDNLYVHEVYILNVNDKRGIGVRLKGN